jgi:LysR family transcriptional regulator, glycine cleavage system transcriptional activator
MMSAIPPFAALRCFEAVARLGGVTLAARELHVTHSAVSQQIKLLEDTMGVALFVREARGLRLTEEGRLYALEVRAALRDISLATRRAQARPQESELVISTVPSFAQHWLVPRLAGFRALHPYYRIRLATSLQIEDLRQGVDIGIRMGQGNWPDVAHRKLLDDDLIAVASPRLAGAPGGRFPVTAEDVMACPLIASLDAPWTDWCRAARVPEPPPASITLTANDSNIVMTALLLGDGVALERRSIVAQALGRGDLVQITGVSVPYPYPYWLVWQPLEIMNTKQTHFAQWIEAQMDAYLRGANPP